MEPNSEYLDIEDDKERQEIIDLVVAAVNMAKRSAVRNLYQGKVSRVYDSTSRAQNGTHAVRVVISIGQIAPRIEVTWPTDQP